MKTSGKQTSSAFVSVGTKLAVCIVVAVALVAGVVSTKLRSVERENLLVAKEQAASMVANLFAGAVVATVEFRDEPGVAEALANLSRNEDVLGVGLWPVVDGRLQPPLGRFTRPGAPPVEKPPYPLGARTRRGGDSVTVDVPVVGPAGATLAVARIVFSLARENAQADEIGRRVLLVSGALAVGLSIVLLLVARRMIVRPLQRLMTAATDLSEGKPARAGRMAEDEIGRLGKAFDSMAAAIGQREERVQATNRDLSLVLNNVGQGFITLDTDGKVSPERSRMVDAWFGTLEGEQALADWVRATDPAWAAWFELGWDMLKDDVLPLDVAIGQLPKRIQAGTRTLEVEYRPITSGERFEKLIVVLTDVTDALERARSEIRRREMMELFRRVLSDRGGIDDFLREARSIMGRIGAYQAGDDPIAFRRDVHTLKGIAGMAGLEVVPKCCHAVEQALLESEREPSDEQKAQLLEAWQATEQIVDDLLPRDGLAMVSVDQADLDSLLDLVRRRADPREVALAIDAWRHEPVRRRLARAGRLIEELARELGKSPVRITHSDSSLRTTDKRWDRFWSAFVHVARNVADHGLETPAERAARGKPPLAEVRLSFDKRPEGLVLTVWDDGAGIDWTRIREKAERAGLPYATRADLEEALCHQGISTRTTVTELSGRGVGMGAVRAEARGLGGELEIESEPGRGTTLRFVFPKQSVAEERVGWYASVPASAN